MKYVMGSDNTVADALSRVASIHAPPAINYNELSGLQANDEELLVFRQNKKFRIEDRTSEYADDRCKNLLRCFDGYSETVFSKSISQKSF